MSEVAFLVASSAGLPEPSGGEVEGDDPPPVFGEEAGQGLDGVGGDAAEQMAAGGGDAEGVHASMA